MSPQFRPDDLDPPPPWDINALRDTAITLLGVPASWVNSKVSLYYTSSDHTRYRTIPRSQIEDIRVLTWFWAHLGKVNEYWNAILWAQYHNQQGIRGWALIWVQRAPRDTVNPEWYVVTYSGRDHMFEKRNSFSAGLWHYDHNPTLKDVAYAFPPFGENGYIEWEGPLNDSAHGLRLNTWEYALGERPEVRPMQRWR